MQLIKLENENSVWYFTSLTKAASFLGTCPANVGRVINGNSPTAKVRGWNAEMIESDEILSYYIDPSQEKIMKHKKEETK